MVGSAVSGAIVSGFGVTLAAPHGGLSLSFRYYKFKTMVKTGLQLVTMVLQLGWQF